MFSKLVKNCLFCLIIPAAICFLASCRTTNGNVNIGWGSGNGSGPAHDVNRTKGGPPQHAPAHGYRAKHHYRYYPACSVYFDMYRKVYFHLEGDTWRMSVSLPQSLRVQLGEYVSIEMDSDKPYMHYDEHRQKYPPGRFKKTAKKKHKWK